jgi:outer membrane receptor protein involved in Fe transport
MLGGVLHYDFIKGGYLGEKGLRLVNDRRTVLEDYISGSLNTRYSLHPNLVLKVNAGRYYRMPSMFELFGNTGRFLGNQDLLPEKGITTDLGVRGRGKWLIAECSFFVNWVWDIISWEVNRVILRPLNVGNARIIGIETMWNIRFCKSIKYYGNLTWQYPVTDDGYLVPWLPLMDSFNRVEYLWRSFKLFCEFSFVDINYKDGHNLFKTPARHMLTTGVAKRWYNDSISTGIEVKNIYNRLDHYDRFGNPLPVLRIFLIIRYN